MTAREDAMFRGYTVVDCPTIITTHITELVKANMSELLSYTETQKLLHELDKDQQKLVEELIPKRITIGGVQRVCKPADGTDINPRPADNTGRHFRSLFRYSKPDVNHGTCPFASVAPDFKRGRRPGRHYSAGDFIGRMGTAFCRVFIRTGRRKTAVHAAKPNTKIYFTRPTSVRRAGFPRRIAGFADQPRHSPVRSFNY